MFNFKKIYLMLILAVGCSLVAMGIGEALAAPAAPARGRAPAAAPATAAPARTTPQTAATTGGVRTPVGARSAATPTTAARSGITPAANPGVAARAASPHSAVTPKQNVVTTGTNIKSQVSNAGVVDPECRERWFGCMDSFCMLDNDNGGRCQCSDQKATFDTILNEIEILDAKILKMATEGLERIEMGQKADYIFAQQEAAMKEKTTQPTRRQPPKLNLEALWAKKTFDEVGFFDEAENPFEDKTGNALHSVVSNMCVSKMAGCEKDLRMLQTMYAAEIQSNCRAYENWLKNEKRDLETKLRGAESTLRAAALEAYETANEYDMGQCIVAFRKCMQEDHVCGDDFTGCVGIAATENAMSNNGKNSTKMYTIKGTSVQIAMSSMETLTSKRPMCDNVTNKCVAVVQKDKNIVWDSFVREIAPTIRSAEIIAESNLRMNCIGTITDCFKKGCNDKFDPSKPDGSFDMCLTRPELMLNVCQIPLKACGIDISSAQAAMKSDLWQKITDRMAAMRIDSCTNDVKQCLTSEDRCGKDYASCVGMDTDSIIALCPPEKLVGCQYKFTGKTTITAAEVHDELYSLVRGIFLGIDNMQIRACQEARDKVMANVCGAIDNCDNMFANDLTIGTEGMILDTSSIDEIVIKGLIKWEKVIDNDGQLLDYEKNISDANIVGAQQSIASVAALNRRINSIKAMISNDLTVQNCINGRDMTNISGPQRDAGGKTITQRPHTTARMPNLLDSSLALIIDAGISRAKENYNRKLGELKTEGMAKMIEIMQRQSEIAPQMCYDKSIMGDVDYLKVRDSNTLPNTRPGS